MSLDRFRSVDIRIDKADHYFMSSQFAKGGDYNGRTLVVQITNGGLIESQAGIAVNLGWYHESVKNTGLDPFEVVDAAQGIFEIAYPKEMLNPGRVTAVIQIIDGEIITETKNFVVQVEKSPIDETTIVSENSFTVLQEALIRINQWNNTIEGKITTWEADMAATKQLYIDTLNDTEATYPIELNSLSQQLEQTLNKSAITLTHMFADNSARDAYFVANPTELMEQLFIKVGTGYQQYLEGAWQASTAIVAEQLSATNQPITDTGNYFATDNTNAALQELGAHKASSANPHGVTKSQVGLGNVDNTSDANKPVSTAVQTALNLKANKTQEAWITPTLVNGWTVADAAFSVGYMKDEMGFVHMRGALKGITNDTFAFSLPVGYRPKQQYEGVIVAGDFTRMCMARVAPSGGVKLTTSGLTWNSLEGITFRAEQ